MLLRRRLVAEREVRGPLVAGDVKDVPEAFGGDHSGPCDLVLEDDVGHNGRAVEELADRARLELCAADQLGDPL